jgi:hypothetical protein
MPIRQDDNQPNRRFGIINLVLIGFRVLLLLPAASSHQRHAAGAAGALLPVHRSGE